MSNHQKSVLRRLNPSQQRQIVVWLQGHTLAETVDYIASEFHIRISQNSVIRFRSWWHMSRSLELAAEFADALRETLTTASVTPEQRDRLQEAAQIAFEMSAIERQDLAAFVNLRKLRQRDQAIEIARQRCRNAGPAGKPSSPSGWTDQDRKAVMLKVDEVFGIDQEPAVQSSSSPSPSTTPPP